jgi:hypothetical protein
VEAASWVLFTIGTVLVASSMWALGLTGTYLGDYFGILMDDMVTGFPFNVSNAPMYDGSALNFLATALWFGSPAGILLTAEVWVMYKIARQFEEYVFSSGLRAFVGKGCIRAFPCLRAFFPPFLVVLIIEQPIHRGDLREERQGTESWKKDILVSESLTGGGRGGNNVKPSFQIDIHAVRKVCKGSILQHRMHSDGVCGVFNCSRISHS